MDIKEFRERGHQLVEWMGDYFENIENFPVKSQVQPGEVLAKLPSRPPAGPESFDRIFGDFLQIILPGITHWQSPSFFAYFNANNSFPSILGEMLTAAMGAQCMSWQTSPAAAELEERVMEWLRFMVGLPEGFTGVIQDTASTATLCSLLTARERATNFQSNHSGYPDNIFTVYCSEHGHSSIDKAVRIAGIGSDNLRKIKCDQRFAVIPSELEKAIDRDSRRGFHPLAVVGAVGTTSSAAVDPVGDIGGICRKRGLWFHVDAAYAGTGLLLPENRWMTEGIEAADTFVFNPHKWMFTNFDCSAYFVRDTRALLNTFAILPEYLRTREGSGVNNYRDWGIQLGRRFRALKLWFVIRSYGVRGLQAAIRSHMDWAAWLGKEITDSRDFELITPVSLGVVCFRYHPPHIKDEKNLSSLNNRLMEDLNATGKIYLTHTRLEDKFTLRFVVGQTRQTREHVEKGWHLIRRRAEELGGSRQEFG